MRASSFLLGLVVVNLLACGAEAPPVAAPIAAPPAAPAPAPTAVAASPLDAASPELKAAIASVEACPFDEPFGFDPACAAYREWLTTRDAPMFKDGAANAVLLAMLKSTDFKARDLAAEKLHDTLDWSSMDVGTLDQLLAAAEKEKNKHVAQALGRDVADSELTRLDRVEQAIAVSKRADPEFRATFLAVAGGTTHDAKLLAYGKEAMATPDLRVAAVHLMAMLAKDAAFAPDACESIGGQVSDASRWVAGQAMEAIPESRCYAQYDDLLTKLDAKRGAKELELSVNRTTLLMCMDQKLKPAQRSRALDLARALASGQTYDPYQRNVAMIAVTECDPKGGKAFVSRFTGDKDPIIASKAKELTAAKKK